MSARSPFRGPLGLARAGFAQIGWSLVWAGLGAAVTALAWPALAPTWLALPIFVAWFFRDPERVVSEHADAVVSPADGRVDDLAEIEACPFVEGRVLRIGIYLSLFSVHVQRAPCDATVVSSAARAGRRVATHRVGELDGNEQHLTTFARAATAPAFAAVRQIAGPVARGIVNVLGPGDRIVRGARFGLIRFGSRVELYLALDVVREVLVRRGDRVRAGASPLAMIEPLANSGSIATSSAVGSSTSDPRTQCP
ncbi:MAG: phosphatidylserine decarboxylase [Planctomycetes bacterium]|nr:phosphatidylserine decarboxylase [Planctomycetota bacterium]